MAVIIIFFERLLLFNVIILKLIFFPTTNFFMWNLTWQLIIRDGETIHLCSYAHCLDADCSCKTHKSEFSSHLNHNKPSEITLRFHSGYYHDRYKDLTKVYVTIFIIHLVFTWFILSRHLDKWSIYLWTGISSWVDHCSKCWYCCLQKLVANYCMSFLCKVFAWIEVVRWAGQSG